MPATTTEPAKERAPGSARKKRYMVSISPRVHAVLKQLAEQYKRPMNWQMVLCIEEIARQNGILGEDECLLQVDEDEDN